MRELGTTLPEQPPAADDAAGPGRARAAQADGLPAAVANGVLTAEARRSRIAEISRASDELMHVISIAQVREFVETRVTMPQLKVLFLVSAAPGLRMSELAARLGVSLSTVSGVVDRMVEQGFLLRSDDPADRRHVVLRLTALGEDQLLQLRAFSERQLGSILVEVEDTDLAVIERSLEILLAAATAAANTAAATAAANIAAATAAANTAAATAAANTAAATAPSNETFRGRTR